MRDKQKQYKRQHEWEKNNYDRVALNLPKGTKEEWKRRAEEAGTSLTEYIIAKVECHQ